MCVNMYYNRKKCVWFQVVRFGFSVKGGARGGR